ncbi:folate-binding protein [Albimonas sp. CAU 1670]|uniref:CAF17-like 4Fe-4S cluster assembly/insertion protein YgfZ n=1 Tax=Albimonas sp. CAU 1670 TaxID=3032599 RepID=UPI0023DAAD3A|nr:folate-binding protein [Albimonas sp. CAU 1670]MDF2233448.1 folate-binding protein [Albimonas sp. CAU 1670]
MSPAPRPHGLVPARVTLRLTGPEARGFLQDLVTNDIRRAEGDRAVYAALLTPQGKYLADFFVLADGPEDLLIDVARDQAQDLGRRLAMYRLRRKVGIEVAPLGVALLWGAEAPTPPEGARLVPDPRDAGLGWRLYAPDPAAALAETGAEAASPADYDALRVALAAPESGVELTPDTFVLEVGFERLNGVDFRKGCYVGQEIVARMKHKTELRRGLVRVAVEGEAPPPGAEILTAEGRAAGVLHTVAGGEGLAHLRLDRSGGELRAGEARLRVL